MLMDSAQSDTPTVAVLPSTLIPEPNDGIPSETEDQPVYWRGLKVLEHLYQEARRARVHAKNDGDETAVALLTQGLLGIADLHGQIRADHREQQEIWGDQALVKELEKERARRRSRQILDAEEIEELAGDVTGWEEVDLGPYLDGSVQEQVPSVLRVRVADGKDRWVFYRGVNWLFGESGDGKTMVATVAAAQELLAGGTVVWIDYEEIEPTTVCARLLEMGVPAEVVMAGLVFRHPQTKAEQVRVDELIRQAVARRECGLECVGLVVLDSVGEAFGVEMINENNDVEVSPWVNRVLRRIAQGLPAAAVLPVDHSTKAKEHRLHPSGSKRKRAAVTGHMVLVEVETGFSREVPGSSVLTCAKDRHGHYTRGAEIALMSVDGRGGALAVDLHERAVGDVPVVALSLFEKRVRAVKEVAAAAGPEGMLSAEAFDKAWAELKEEKPVTKEMRAKILAALGSDAHKYVQVSGATSSLRITVWVLDD